VLILYKAVGGACRWAAVAQHEREYKLLAMIKHLMDFLYLLINFVNMDLYFPYLLNNCL